MQTNSLNIQATSTASVLDVVLQSLLQLIVGIIPFLELEVHQCAVTVIKRKQIILCLLICFQILLKLSRVATIDKVSSRAVVAVSIMRHELFDMNAVRFGDDVVFVVDFVAVGTLDLGFLDLN